MTATVVCLTKDEAYNLLSFIEQHIDSVVEEYNGLDQDSDKIYFLDFLSDILSVRNKCQEATKGER